MQWGIEIEKKGFDLLMSSENGMGSIVFLSTGYRHIDFISNETETIIPPPPSLTNRLQNEIGENILTEAGELILIN